MIFIGTQFCNLVLPSETQCTTGSPGTCDIILHKALLVVELTSAFLLQGGVSLHVLYRKLIGVDETFFTTDENTFFPRPLRKKGRVLECSCMHICTIHFKQGYQSQLISIISPKATGSTIIIIRDLLLRSKAQVQTERCSCCHDRRCKPALVDGGPQ